MSKKIVQITSPKFSRGKLQAQKFEVVRKLHLDPFPGQRSHEAHLEEVSFLRKRTPLCGPQLMFAIVEYPHPQIPGRRVRQLLDGYTRLEAVKQGLMQPPADGYVNTETFVVKSFEEAKELYNWYNNVATSKRSKHEVQSAVRHCTDGKADRFSSPLLVKGPFVSALRHCGIVQSTVFDKVVTGFAAYKRLDDMRLPSTHETTGLIAAYLVLMQFEPEQEAAASFIQKMNQQVFIADPKYPQELAVQAARKFHLECVQSKMTAGKDNCDTIRDYVLQMFMVYLRTRNRAAVPGWVEALTLGSYLEDATKRRKAA